MRVVLAIVGGVLLTVTVLLPLMPPLVAVTLPLPVVAGAVNRPPPLTVHPLATVVVQVKLAGCVDRVLPNWSLAVAVNCCVPVGFRVADAGLSRSKLSRLVHRHIDRAVGRQAARIGDRRLAACSCRPR